MDITLVVLAAGIGSRYGAGIKQLEKVGPSGEIIMDYAIHDALKAGFNRVVFIVRRNIMDDFQEVIGNRLEKIFSKLGVQWNYAFQEMTDLPEGRVKPWGTGQAVLACQDLLKGPFAVINADDYYGKHAYKHAYAFLKQSDQRDPNCFGMVGFVLKNTLSEAGEVTRGLCTMDEKGYLTDIEETRHIVKTPEGAAVAGAEGMRPLDGDGVASMNMWMLTPAFVDSLAEGFDRFKKNMKDPLRDEYLLPDIVGSMVRNGTASVKVFASEDRWFGITYSQDKKLVAEAFHAMADKGEYAPDLFSDL